LFFYGDNVDFVEKKGDRVGGDREKKGGNGERGSGFVLWFFRLAGIS